MKSTGKTVVKCCCSTMPNHTCPYHAWFINNPNKPKEDNPYETEREI